MAARKSTVALGLAIGLLLLLVVAEIAAIIWLTGAIGWWTIAFLMGSTVLGIYLMQREWKKAWASLSDALRAGQLPTGRMADTTLILAGGILLTVPGVITDVIGLLLLLPFTRPFIRSALTWWVSRVVKSAPGAAGPTIIKGEATEADTLIPRIQATNNEAADGQVIRGDLDES
ncbi:MAG: FxsA family protein [Propionibacteriaceae bacterium]|nr:FxsA family protein [Propionibacteriaceae bacterium]